MRELWQEVVRKENQRKVLFQEVLCPSVAKQQNIWGGIVFEM
jgi:hypothetical protein